MNYMEAVESDLAAREAIDILLQVAEVLPNDKIIRLTQILGDGGAAYHQRNIFTLLKMNRCYEDKDRVAGMFTEADFPEGFRDTRIRAALFLGLHKLVKSDGTIDQAEASAILKDYQVPESPDLRDNLAAYAHRTPEGKAKWDITDFTTSVLAATSLASLARRVPWGRLAKFVLRRGR